MSKKNVIEDDLAWVTAYGILKPNMLHFQGPDQRYGNENYREIVLTQQKTKVVNLLCTVFVL